MIIDSRIVKITCLLAGFSFYFLHVNCQVFEFDSLLALDHDSYHDTVRLEIFYQLAQHENTDIKLEYSRKLAVMAEQISSPTWLFRAHLNIGQAYSKKDDYENALTHQFRALELSSSQEPHRKGLMYIEIANTYSDAKDSRNAMAYYRQAINYFQQPDIPYSTYYLMLSNLNLGDELIFQSKYDSAGTVLKIAREYADQLDYRSMPIYRALIMGNLGIVNKSMGQTSLAQQQLVEAIDLLTQHDDLSAVSIYLTHLADIFIHNSELDAALPLLVRSLDLAVAENLLGEIRDAHFKLANIHARLDQFEKAYHHQYQYILYRDSINNEEVIQRMADQRTGYEVGLKQAEVDLLEARRRTQLFVTIGLGVFIVIILIGALVIYRYYLTKTRLSNELEKQKAELQKLNKTKDKFFSIISHDLRSPVSAFQGISRMIQALVATKQTDDLLEMTKDIDESVHRLSTLLDNLLNWAMQQQGQFPNVPERVDLRELADDMVRTFANMAKGKNISLVHDISTPITLWVDRNSTATVVRNLVSNALKFTPEKGKVQISAEVTDDHCNLQISDTGLGIPQEKVEQLFKIQQVKSSYGTGGEKGLGLGLQLVHEFVRMNNGSIEVESKVDQGTTFSIMLPLFDASRVEQVIS